MMRQFVILIVMGLATGALAQAHVEEHPSDAHSSRASAEAHPVITEDSTWAGVMLIVIIGGFFLPAAVIGPIARTLLPEDEPQATSHDEPPGSSHHHGPEGTDEPAHADSHHRH